MTNGIYDEARQLLRSNPRKWLVTGAAGFIGSNLTEALLALDQTVIGLDNFATGFQRNLDEALDSVDFRQAAHFTFVEGDIRSLDTCRQVCAGVDVVLHQAALGSVPRSINDPIATNQTNVDGFLNMLVAAKEAKVDRFIYAASSSTYGDHPELPKVEDRIGNPLSPYAVSKYTNELYAQVFGRAYDMRCLGLRYFNVFGRRQDPDGAYAAVIPKWFSGFLRDEPIYINGDGETSRDFCYIENVIQANILAGMVPDATAFGKVYNIAHGESTTLNELFVLIRDLVAPVHTQASHRTPAFRDFRIADVRHSLADITRAKTLLHYLPVYTVRQGLAEAATWYIDYFHSEGND